MDAPGRLAIYVDYENIRKGLQEHFHMIADPLKVAQAIMRSASGFGRVLTPNVYGDWSEPHPTSGGGRVHSVRQFEATGFQTIMVARKASGQDRTDMRLALDAHEALLLRPELTGFMIVSGDGDYGDLARRMRSREKRVIICGIGLTISRELIAMADPLVTLETLLGLSPPLGEVTEPRTETAKRQFEWVPFIVAVDQAEKRLPKVVFKYFRDTWLPSKMGASEPRERQEIMNEAIAQQIIEVFQAPNPKNQEYPVTCVRLNRGHELVQATLKSS